MLGRRFGRKTSIGLLALGLGLLAGTAGVTGAHAGFSSCRTDPMINLSNGMTVKLVASMAVSSASGVKNITYTVHGPTGTSVKSIVYTGTGWSGKEQVVYLADSSNTLAYHATTVVNTYVAGVSTSAQMSVYATKGSTAHTSSAASGPSGSNLNTAVTY